MTILIVLVREGCGEGNEDANNIFLSRLVFSITVKNYNHIYEVYLLFVYPGRGASEDTLTLYKIHTISVDLLVRQRAVKETITYRISRRSFTRRNRDV